ncbi:MAG: hypothetical protein ABIW76_03240 [Fibrobacteria bacterium]
MATPADPFKADPLEEIAPGAALAGFRGRIHRIIFKSDTAAGRAFDLVLVWAILISMAAVLLESVASLWAVAGHAFVVVKWASGRQWSENTRSLDPTRCLFTWS